MELSKIVIEKGLVGKTKVKANAEDILLELFEKGHKETIVRNI